jgi:hypothetical protein
LTTGKGSNFSDLSSDLKDQIREHFEATEDELTLLRALQLDESVDVSGKAVDFYSIHKRR